MSTPVIVLRLAAGNCGTLQQQSLMANAQGKYSFDGMRESAIDLSGLPLEFPLIQMRVKQWAQRVQPQPGWQSFGSG